MQFSRSIITLSCWLLTHLLSAQSVQRIPSGEVKQLLKKLNILGSVLYVAAHPDDENTRLIAYYANEKLFNTAYLSATRGDGGQNLIGPEISQNLGLIRTQELLAARLIDGGTQFFSRANDFGYSKNPNETLSIWDKEKVLEDFVRVIRIVKPDVIITRFNTQAGITHGHHTTSTLLALEAFDLAGDSSVYPEQLKALEVWQPKKLFWNTSSWFYARNQVKFNPEGLYSINVGTYNPNLGMSYTEMAAQSRSMHKSQGFGSTGSRGDELEYLELWRGDSAGIDVFAGIDTSWDRVEKSQKVSQFLLEAQEVYKAENPKPALHYLLKAREELIKMSDQYWKEIKLDEINQVIMAITGTYLEVVADDYSYVRGARIKLSIEAINRIDFPIELVGLTIEPWGFNVELDQEMHFNQKIVNDYSLNIPDSIALTSPYWLNEKGTLGMYYVADKDQIGQATNDPTLHARFTLAMGNQYLELTKPIHHKFTDPVDGEVYRPIAIVPDVAINLSVDNVVFSDENSKSVDFRLITGKDNVSGKFHVVVPQGWQTDKNDVLLSIPIKNEERVISIKVKPEPNAMSGDLKAYFISDNESVSNQQVQIIAYDHIPVQTVLKPAKIDLIKLNMIKLSKSIGYIEGAGDMIPDLLRQIGYKVSLLDKDDVTIDNLRQFDAVVLGVRAFNTVDWLAYKNQELFDYSFKGGTVLVQYNTNRNLVTKDIAPYPLSLSRDRVSVETATVSILEPGHRSMNFPNKIVMSDFDGWVQERGLYFCSEWDDKFTPILSSNDPGESPKKGGLLVASHGEGYYIYSGYSWFRELPAGVEGAYRIFTNLLSIGKD
ncbi:MAG: LmbE family protein [Flammeovirgaceae bacterium]|nr:LmbE family protein [Flammeovirgaceae bacterium]|tara:strand:- start:758 stop:3247 length:2490 start_codon:yes stop_codon:yes gene_type:complete